MHTSSIPQLASIDLHGNLVVTGQAEPSKVSPLNTFRKDAIGLLATRSAP